MKCLPKTQFIVQVQELGHWTLVEQNEGRNSAGDLFQATTLAEAVELLHDTMDCTDIDDFEVIKIERCAETYKLETSSDVTDEVYQAYRSEYWSTWGDHSDVPAPFLSCFEEVNGVAA